MTKIAVGAALMLMCGSALLAAPAQPAPAKDPSAVTDPRSQTLKPFIFCFAKTRTNFTSIEKTLNAVVPELKKSMLAAGAERAGSLVLIYHGASDDMNKEFDLEVGFPIAAKVAPKGNINVRDVAEFPCTSVLFTGAFSQFGDAYGKLIPAAMANPGGITDEVREMYLYFEGKDSPNNVVHVSVGLKKK